MKALLLCLFLGFSLLLKAQNDGKPISPLEDPDFIGTLHETMPYIVSPYIVSENCNSQECSDKILLTFIKENITYPPGANPEEFAGRIFVRFTIDTLGKMQDISILKTMVPEPYKDILEKEALRVIELLSDRFLWHPATLVGAKRECRIVVPVKLGPKL